MGLIDDLGSGKVGVDTAIFIFHRSGAGLASGDHATLPRS
jgi:hypothetical protein